MARNNPPSATKHDRLSIRVDPARKAVIARAAKQLGDSISEFVLENAYQVATELLADERSDMHDQRRWFVRGCHGGR
ncbi:MAG TPA: DUF1778 domain-containing protein [Gemmatales bacterium]|nr:DUF1778 domain-containing protein [Gemmatales bacterium]HMP59767.1 DUF1778 domain-containing protein [Gemmatales bacterium]